MPKRSNEVPLADGKLIITHQEDDYFEYLLYLRCPFGPDWKIADYFTFNQVEEPNNIEGFTDLATLLAYIHGNCGDDVLQILGFIKDN